jgi:hypothetical protein
MSNVGSSSDSGQLSIEDITPESEPKAKTIKLGAHDLPGQIFLANLQQSMQHSYRTVVNDAEAVEKIMKDASADGVLSPLQQDVIDTLSEGNVNVFMLGIHPDLTDDSHQVLSPGTQFQFHRTPWTQPVDRLTTVSDSGSLDEE